MVVKTNVFNFEEALNMTGFSRYNVYMFLLSGSIIVGMGFEIFSVSYLVPGSACELGTTSSQQGIMASMPLVGIIATSHFWGYLADIKGRRQVLIISMTMSFLGAAAAAFSPNWIVLSCFKLLSSASVSGAYALSLTLLSESTPMAKRSFFVILSNSVFLSATGVMAVISIPILPLTFSYYIPVLNIHFNSWRLLCLIFSLPSAFSAMGVSCAYESPKYLLSVGREEEALKVLKGMYVVNFGKTSDNYQVESVVLGEDGASSAPKNFWQSLVAQTVPMFKPPLLKYSMLLAALFVFCYICINSFMVWLPVIINAFMSSVISGNEHLTICEMIRSSKNITVIDEPTDCSMNSIAMTMTFGINIFLAVCNVCMSGLVSCCGRKTVFIGIQVVGGTAALCINSSPYWVLSASLFMVFLTGVINFGFLSTFSIDIFPTYVRAMAVCMTLMVGRASAVFGINLLKKLLDVDCEAAFYIFGSISITGGLIGLLLPSDAKLLAHNNKLQKT